MDMNEATSKALAAERAAARLTIKELARKSGLNERTLIRILQGERNINVLQIAQLAAVFDVYPHEIIETAERFLQRDERGDVDLAGVSDDPPSEDGSSSSRIRGVLDYDLAAKRGDVEAEQEEYMEEP